MLTQLLSHAGRLQRIRHPGHGVAVAPGPRGAVLDATSRPPHRGRATASALHQLVLRLAPSFDVTDSGGEHPLSTQDLFRICGGRAAGRHSRS
jgi:hypothetical protein